MILELLFAFAAHATDDMETETKKTEKPAAESTQAAAKPALSLDPALRAKIRSKAPFWIDDARRGAPIRINKDGTFSSEAQGGGSIAGDWKALKGGQLLISWGNGGEKYQYKVGASGKQIQIEGRKISGGRVRLN